MKLHSCETCRMRAYAERRPRSILSRIWKWHSGWCPMWKAHQRKLAESARVASEAVPSKA